jgi:hypothetical protein
MSPRQAAVVVSLYGGLVAALGGATVAVAEIVPEIRALAGRDGGGGEAGGVGPEDEPAPDPEPPADGAAPEPEPAEER